MKQVRLSKLDVDAMKIALRIALRDPPGEYGKLEELMKRWKLILNRLERLKVL